MKTQIYKDSFTISFFCEKFGYLILEFKVFFYTNLTPMDNNQIVEILKRKRDEKLDDFSKMRLTEEFEQQYNEMSPHIHLLGEEEQVFLNQLKIYMNDKSIDSLLQKYIQLLKSVDKKTIKENFKVQIISFFNFLNQAHSKTETILIHYNSYEDKDSSASGFTKQNINDITQPRYIDDEINWEQELFNSEPIFNFNLIWLEIEELEFTTICLDVYYQMQRLFQLESFIYLHEAFLEINQEKNNSMKFQNTLHFFISEHDSEVYHLYNFMK